MDRTALNDGLRVYDGRAFIKGLGVEAFAVGPDNSIPTRRDARLREVRGVGEFFDGIIIGVIPGIELSDGAIAPIDQNLAALGKLEAGDELRLILSSSSVSWRHTYALTSLSCLRGILPERRSPLHEHTASKPP